MACGNTPSLPPIGNYQFNVMPLRSRALDRVVPVSVAMPDGDFPALPVIIALPGEGGDMYSVGHHLGLPNYAHQAGLKACILSFGDVGSSYYHPRSDGTDMLAFIVDELVPQAEQGIANIASRHPKRALYGYSMGGFGALLVAQERPEMIRAAVAASPAVFPSFDDAVTGHPHTFDSKADWERYGVWNRLTSMGEVPVRIDCGDADPFAPTARQLLAKIPNAKGAISSGCHDVGFWRRTAPTAMEFLKEFLT